MPMHMHKVTGGHMHVSSVYMDLIILFCWSSLFGNSETVNYTHTNTGYTDRIYFDVYTGSDLS